MKIAIVHYHLAVGGVSHVIAVASRSLTRLKVPHVVLADGEPDPSMADLPVRRVEGLGYREGAHQVRNSGELLERMKSAAREQLGGDPDIWHFHNHSLGKNPLMAEVVAQLAEEGQRLVLQIHDLAEDGRQQNYAAIADKRRLYPTGPEIRYVFLNEHDRGVFVQQGLAEAQSTVVFNPVELLDKLPEPVQGDPILFAPIRGIRRKNIGELVFLSAIAPAGTRIAISRAPEEPRALNLHETWKKFAAYLRLPIGFDVVGRYQPADGSDSDFEAWVRHATHFVTTSVAESFGQTFIEASVYGKPLLGRSIPRVAAEHKKLGLKPGDLYEHLMVPIEWVDISILRQHFDTTLERNYRYLGRQLTRPIIEGCFATLVRDGWIDFGNMPEPIQQSVVERLSDPGCRHEPLVVVDGERRPAKEWLHQVLKRTEPGISQDQLKAFSPEVYGDLLKGMYEGVMKAECLPPVFLEPEPILSAFLAPESFHFLSSVIPPKATTWSQYRAVIFDIYGTLLIAPKTGVPEPSATMDGLLQGVLDQHGFDPPDSPTQELNDAVKRHHEASPHEFPEVDMRVIWREILGLDSKADITNLVVAIEDECCPTQPMPGASAFIRRLAHSGVSLGLLSNGQCNTLRALGGIRDFFAPELTLISYQHGMAKPALELFQIMAERLACRGIKPEETLFIGNDPVRDIVPAAACGFKTALFTGHPDSARSGNCTPDHEINGWPIPQGMRRC